MLACERRVLKCSEFIDASGAAVRVFSAFEKSVIEVWPEKFIGKGAARRSRFRLRKSLAQGVRRSRFLKKIRDEDFKGAPWRNLLVCWTEGKACLRLKKGGL